MVISKKKINIFLQNKFKRHIWEGALKFIVGAWLKCKN